MKNNYRIIHCHTPMGGTLGRLAAMGKPAGIIYTAHGFHFYRGAPLFNWLVYYPIEKYLAKFTSMLVTLNNEDFTLGRNKLTGCGKIVKINGVGVNTDIFRPLEAVQREALRLQHNCGGCFVVLYAAEFIARKNHIYLLKRIRDLAAAVPAIKIFLPGEGDLKGRLKKYAERRGLLKYIEFPGYRKDIHTMYALADIVLSPSRQEGLPLNIAEGLASGLPVVCSNIRGHTDIICEGRNGFLFDLDKPDQMTAAVKRLAGDPSLYREIAANNLRDAKKFSLENAVNAMAAVYTEYL